MLKVGLVGIGGMGFVHYNAYKRIEGAEVVAVADVRTEMAKEKIKEDKVNIYSNIDELLANEKVDVIDICSPSYLHTDIAMKALAAGCHTLSEKPMSISTADTARVIELAKKVGKKFMTAHVVRFMAPYVYLRGVIESGELGKIVHLNMKRISSVPRWSWEDWMRDIKKSGGTPIDLSIHDIDFAYSVFGEPKSVNGIYNELKDNNDYIVSNLVYDGFTVTTTGGWFNAQFPFTAEFFAIFENGMVKLEGGKLYKNGEEVDLAASAKDVSENMGINIPRADGYTAEIEYFLECVKNDEPVTRVTPESSEGSVRLVERILANAIKV